jgi:prolipoprotein diacylglyceryl transferase
VNWIAGIPSPSSGGLDLGPLKLNAYGAMIALGVVAAVWLGGKRLVARGIGTTDDMSAIAMWGVPFGVVGARLYHVITDWQLFRDNPGAIVQIWKGGLGIWGGIALGTLVGIGVARKRGLPVGLLLTCVAPALPLAQSIGRWGNWFNQELFGRPTTLPWGLEVSASTAQSAGYAAGTQFHPTFLYESIACLLLCGALIVLDNKVPMRAGRLFFFYTAGYTVFRFFIEGLRIDPAHDAGGLRLNQWVSLAVFAASVAVIISMRGRPATTEPTLPESAD